MKRLLTPEEAAELLAVSPKSVRKWLWQGKLKGVRVGRLWRIRESDLEAFLEDRSFQKSLPQREYTRQEIRGFLKADKIAPEVARQVERLLNR
ncbi:excisionase-like protein [Thermacetogenium phaeum DSM 12270]|uniref:Excisionase-like protein n=1 Tax=Thermacetogenium phaeum (strain ATCC BAA-254 / DSM 26808 / PB) TaxID=1089553 RepID=K4LEM8_THEPS|nr:helix-turn-helix domain-containing protein [Thermacetogenium phaeum]AFV10552.1 excisionase-like protein [Thermacetogenium phaeum DSM 12270]